MQDQEREQQLSLPPPEACLHVLAVNLGPEPAAEMNPHAPLVRQPP